MNVQKDPTLLPKVMNYLRVDMEIYNRADYEEALLMYNKFGTILNVACP